jgi:two-component system, LuxR family, sensor kinase FixL
MWGSAEQWPLIADRLAVPVAYTDSDARVRFANATFERQFDFSPNSAVGQSLWDIIVPGSTTGDPATRIQRGDALTFLAIAQSKEGGRTWGVLVSCVPQRDASGKVVGCVVVVTDAHDRPDSGEDSDGGRLRAVLAATPDGVVLFDERGVIDTANAAVAQMFGYPVGGLVGRSVHLLIPAISGALDPWAVGSRNVEAVRRDGTHFAVEVSVRAAGRSFAGVIRDMARTRELERQVVDAADAVRKAVGEDLHDNVGQQLTGLELMVDALARRVTVSDRVTSSLVAKVAEGLKQAHADIRQLMTGIIPTEVPADGFVATLERLVTRVRECYDRKCDLVTTNPVQLPDAATATHLFRIVQEAVCNAIRHGHTKVIRLTVREEPDALVVEVRDDGGGFSNNANRHGLGTRLMQDRATRIGGTLTITAVDGGTVVTVCLPTAASDGVKPDHTNHDRR